MALTIAIIGIIVNVAIALLAAAGVPGRRKARQNTDDFSRQLRLRLPGLPWRVAFAGGTGLSPRELAILRQVADGRADKQIARDLGIRPHTASKHVKNIMRKMNSQSRTAAAVRAVRDGLIG